MDQANMMTVEQEERKLKTDLHKVLATLDKCVTEKDLRKAYRDTIGHNVNIPIEKIKAGNFIHFLRFKCRDFCEVDKLEGIARVHRLFEQPVESEEPKSHKKKHRGKSAPKLNVPRNGLINSMTFPRLNPQGFNKGKANKEGKSLTTLPFYQPKYPLAYRSEAQLTKFKKASQATHDEPLSSEEESYVYDRTFAEVTAAEPKGKKAPEASAPLSVKNPFDFPSLPAQNEGTEEHSDHDPEDHEEYSSEEEEEESGGLGQSSVEAAEEVLEQMKNLTLKKSCSAHTLFYPKLDLDDPIFRLEFPPVVTDPNFKIPSPKLKVLAEKVVFEVNLTLIHSPAQFWFQYGDASLYFLMNRLKAFYSNLTDDDLYMSRATMQPGLVVAAKVMTSWHRVQVVNEPDSSGQVNLFFLDFGTYDLVHFSNIRYLLKTFAETPVKALRGQLVGVFPALSQGKWNYSACKAFFELVAQKKLFACIRSSSDDCEVCKLELTDKINSEMRICQALIRLGLAVASNAHETFPYAIPLPG